jgi:hypothetical protein
MIPSEHLKDAMSAINDHVRDLEEQLAASQARVAADGELIKYWVENFGDAQRIRHRLESELDAAREEARQAQARVQELESELATEKRWHDRATEGMEHNADVGDAALAKLAAAQEECRIANNARNSAEWECERLRAALADIRTWTIAGFQDQSTLVDHIDTALAGASAPPVRDESGETIANMREWLARGTGEWATFSRNAVRAVLAAIDAPRTQEPAPAASPEDEQRHGQWLWNHAMAVFPECIEPIRGTESDCFYDDRKAKLFLQALVRLAGAAPAASPSEPDLRSELQWVANWLAWLLGEVANDTPPFTPAFLRKEMLEGLSIIREALAGAAPSEPTRAQVPARESEEDRIFREFDDMVEGKLPAVPPLPDGWRATATGYEANGAAAGYVWILEDDDGDVRFSICTPSGRSIFNLPGSVLLRLARKAQP